MYALSIEKHHWICVYQLKRNGLFACRACEKTSINLDDQYTVEYDPAKRIITIGDPLGERDEHVIGVTIRRQGVCQKTYFVCPITGRLTTRIHHIEGRWGARIAFPDVLPKNSSRQHRKAERIEEAADRLLGRNGYPKAKGANRDKLVRLIQCTPFIEDRKPELSHIISEPPPRSSRRRNAMQQVVPNSTRAALKAGHALSAEDVVAILEEAQVRECRTWAELGTNHRLVPLEDQLSLDVRELAKTGLLRKPSAGHLLIWKDWFRHEIAKAAIALDLFSEHPRLVIRSRGNQREPLRDHVIALACAPHRRRFYLICPRSGRRAEILYLRDGVFGAATASRLIHRSQRSLAFGS